jgi:hypothetical protein
MPKEERKIHSAVRVDTSRDRGDGRMNHHSEVFGPGDEDRMAEELDKGQIKRLTESGAISGFGVKSPERAEGAMVAQPIELNSPAPAATSAPAEETAKTAPAKPAAK